MATRTRTSGKPPTRPSRPAHGAKRAAKILDRLDKADRQAIADAADKPNRWNRPVLTKPALSRWRRKSTPALAAALRKLATIPDVPALTTLLAAAADRLDAYERVADLGTEISNGNEIITHEIDMSGFAEDRIDAAIKAATVALRSVPPTSPEARKRAQQGKAPR